jgi:hypothetical protein
MKKYFWFWNIDYKRYELLKILSKNRTLNELRLEKSEKLGVSFEGICKKLKCNREELHGITSELYENQEILYTDVELKGLYGNRKGIQSNTNRKYLKIYYALWLDLGRNFSQIIIPTASLIIATTVLLKDNASIESKLKVLKEEIITEIKQKEKSQILPKKMEIDSLSKMKNE